MFVRFFLVFAFFFSIFNSSFCDIRNTEASSDSFSVRLGKLEIPKEFALKEILFGDPNASVELIIYFSYTCPHCRVFHQKEFSKFAKKYVDTGKVKIIFRNYLDDQGAFDAAQIVRCLCEERSSKKNRNSLLQYLELSGKILDKQIQWIKSATPVDFLINIFVEAGYQKEKVLYCLSRTDIGAGLMLEQKRAMHQYGLVSMPVFICGKEIWVGSVTCEELEDFCKLKKLHPVAQ